MFGLNKLLKKKKYRIGWILMSAYPNVNSSGITLRILYPTDHIRYALTSAMINRVSPDIRIERYNPRRKYDLVIFTRLMNEKAKDELKKIKAYGGRIMFDANVNYYEVEGDFVEEGARFKPTPEQSESARFMVENADYVIAASTYLHGVCSRYNKNVVWIPDAVDLNLFDGKKIHSPKNRTVLLWSGVPSKSYHLKIIKDVLTSLKDIELLIICEKGPLCDVVRYLREKIPCTFLPYSYYNFPKFIKKADILISPKIVNNSYEKGHTEFKITVGMAQRLPVVASPQQSYVECMEKSEAGFICNKPQEWHEKLKLLIQDHNLRNIMGNNARKRVEESYSGEITAKKYLDVIHKLLVK